MMHKTAYDIEEQINEIIVGKLIWTTPDQLNVFSKNAAIKMLNMYSPKDEA